MEKKEKKAFTFENDFMDNFSNWKEEVKNNQKFQSILNTTEKVKSRVVSTTKKILENKVISKLVTFIDKNPVMVIITLWILAIFIMGSLLMGSITAGIVFTVYLAVYTIMYFLLYHLLTIFAGLAVIGVSKVITIFKKGK